MGGVTDGPAKEPQQSACSYLVARLQGGGRHFRPAGGPQLLDEPALLGGLYG